MPPTTEPPGGFRRGSRALPPRASHEVAATVHNSRNQTAAAQSNKLESHHCRLSPKLVQVQVQVLVHVSELLLVLQQVLPLVVVCRYRCRCRCPSLC